ncbi:hypothetical protein PHLCEN_2v7012 [Hermanssonia centrifuga]|uniref:Uncharacterized protein n=1 Tax=Hermanssonia centrifuga TaxID=98765 RepID=A0A2R6NXQ7_9APHY|nr:hypothetical protein PHLCEN_2v7012 [Hermanssonia centrifuga]
MVVFISVPLVRRRKARELRGLGQLDLESSMRSKSGWGFGSRKSSFRHHQETRAGPDALLPLLPEMSTFTWSDLRSHNTSAESIGGDMDVVDVYSFPTNNATTSHLNLKEGLIESGQELTDSLSVVGGPSGTAPKRGSARVPPSAKRSVTPPGLSSKASSSRETDESVVDQSSALFYARPNIPLVLPASDATLSNSSFYKPGIAMEPVLEQTVNSHSTSRSGSLQLPSPPASPPHTQLQRSKSHTRSQSQASTQQADWRFSTPRPRPSLSSTISAPNALPFRPTSSSTSTCSPRAVGQLPHSPPTSSLLSPHSLTNTFRSPLHRSNSQSTTSDIARYPSLTSQQPIPEGATWSPSARSRAGSTASERPARPQGARPRPVEMLREEGSESAVRSSGRRASMSAAPPAAFATSEDPTATDAHGSHRAYLRSSVSIQTPPTEVVHTPEGQTMSPSYFDPRYRHTLTAAAPPGTSGSPSSYSLSPSRRSSISQGTTTPLKSQPALVRRKDSPALRPIPVSTLMYSPPTSPPHYGSSSGFTAPSAYSQSRSRAASVASVAPSRDGSVYEGRSGRRHSVRSVLPSVDSLSPMDFEKFSEGGRNL